MWKNLLLSLVIYIALVVTDDTYKTEGDYASIRRNRMFKFTLYQDLFVALNVLKMMVIEGYTICGVVERFRSSGITAHMYLATSVILHGSLLFDESIDQYVRLNPSPYTPLNLDKDQMELFLL